MILSVRVTANASRDHVDQVDLSSFKVYVTCVAEDGNANRAVIKLLSKFLQVPKSSMVLLRGVKSRDKIFQIAQS